MKDILEIVKYLEDSELLLSGVSERIKNETKSNKRNMLADKRVIRAGEVTARVGYRSKRSSFFKNNCFHYIL